MHRAAHLAPAAEYEFLGHCRHSLLFVPLKLPAGQAVQLLATNDPGGLLLPGGQAKHDVEPANGTPDR